MRGPPSHNTRSHAQMPPSFLGKDTWMTSQLKMALLHKATWVIDVLSLFFDMSSVGVCTTKPHKTSGRLLQELNVCTVVTT